MIGADRDTIHKAEDRNLFKAAMSRIGLQVAPSGHATTVKEAWDIVQETGFPSIIRPSFTLGGTGGSIAYSSVTNLRPWSRRPCISAPRHRC